MIWSSGTYLLNFLGLEDTYSERDLEAAILRELPGEEPPLGLSWAARRTMSRSSSCNSTGARSGGGVSDGAAAKGDSGGQAARGHTTGEKAGGKGVVELKEMPGLTGFIELPNFVFYRVFLKTWL